MIVRIDDRSGSRRVRARGVRLIGSIALALALVAPGLVTAKQFTTWGTAVKEEAAINSPQADGCPIESPNGLSLYIASTRTGTFGGNDIWVSHRTDVGGPWTTPENLGEPVNSTSADFCPTPLNGNALLFVSERPGGCGSVGGDMYFTRNNPVHGWEQPVNLGCNSSGGPNTSGAEFSPSLVETDEGVLLYFSSNVAGTQDIYVSRQRTDGTFGPGELVEGLNLATHDDQMPNVSRDGLEIVFASTRPGTLGSFDVYTAHRESTSDPWSEPVNVGSSVNTERPETRPSLSGDGERLHFGRPDVIGGPADIWVSTRVKVTGGD